MKPIGPLMREHRLIERMVILLDAGLKHITEKGEVNVDLRVMAADFFKNIC